ncbi:tripartite tricarboxylate transporter substrate binding protein [Candidimonas humi]|jgi:tripartite-type tricarboxylate transporter receptor subunit TctC|uniref:Bug family tripartite tricarboxylate transporter substrate binding protein n=1 Tax=Candidimonas humi TaxID=683355 RepID=A0ABV8P2Q7_9BURK|nr:tripartite tricarboxylate transporter substrate binding protein [Candidimonas humi]MBV6307303.1 tripartite tricarboxylate transporter substrate binding protein [Candidimonas humi]
MKNRSIDAAGRNPVIAQGVVPRRRAILQAAAAALTLPVQPLLWQQAVAAETYPSRPIRFVVGFPPGQTTDIIARAYAAAMSGILKTPIIVDNKAGANGILAAQVVKAADPDGYTLLFGTSGQMVINPALYAHLSYDTAKDFVPVAPIARGRLFLVVNNDLPVHSLRDLLAYAKAHPGKLRFGSGGVGITSHLAMEMLKSATGLDASHIPYKGSPAALNALIRGDVQTMFDSGGSLLPLVNSGKIRAIAVSTLDRYPGLPKLPTVAEQGEAGFQVYAWNAVLAPRGTSPAVVDKLRGAFAEAGKAGVVQASLKAAAHDLLPVNAADLGKFIQTEIARWHQAVAAAGIKPE